MSNLYKNPVVRGTFLAAKLLFIGAFVFIGINSQTGSKAATAPSFTFLNPGTPFAPSSFWNAPLPANAPLDANNAAYSNNLVKQVRDNYGGVAGVNHHDYTANLYVVDANTPTQTIKFKDCQNQAWKASSFIAHMGAVPIPDNAQPSPGTDAEMVIYQPSTDTEWEMWVSEKKPDGWYACWGGKLTGVSRSNGIFPHPYGTAATGISLMGAPGRVSEFYAGEIKHAMGLALISPRKWDYYSWPATRTDGFQDAPDAIPEGMRLRLDPTVNVDSLSLHPVAKMIAKAAQQYGFVVIDKSGIVGVRVENSAQFVNAGVGNPYTQTVTINGVTHPPIFGSTPGYDIMRNFPWGKMQFLSCDYGKPAGTASKCPPAPAPAPTPTPAPKPTPTPSPTPTPATGNTQPSGGTTQTKPSATKKTTVVSGVFNIGSSNNGIKEAKIDGKPVQGNSIDTTQLSDGEHTISYTTADGQTKQEKIVIDNDQPANRHFVNWMSDHKSLTSLAGIALIASAIETFAWIRPQQFHAVGGRLRQALGLGNVHPLPAAPKSPEPQVFNPTDKHDQLP